VSTTYNESFKGRFRKGKHRAKKAGMSWELTLDQYVKIVTPCKCDYCGGTLPPVGAGIDRKDSSKGYTLKNVVPCCWECNRIKSDQLSYKEMKLIAGVLKLLSDE